MVIIGFAHNMFTVLRWKFIKENKKVRKRREQELDQKSDQENKKTRT